MKNWIWVDSDRALEEALVDVPAAIALDTEFMRTNTFYPLPGLYQLGMGDRVLLIDPEAIDDWTPLLAVLRDERITKVMHACQEDIELFFSHLGETPRNIFDTQLAHAFLSDQYSLSYARLVEARLGVALDKQNATRSNWLARPLSAEQLAYAVEDVTHLLPLYEDLGGALDAQSRVDWFMNEMEDRGAYNPVPPEHYYINVKKAWHFDLVELGRLRALCAWRERTARRENVPRNRVVWDDHLYGFARSADLTRGAIRAALPRVVAAKYEEGILEALADATEAPSRIERPLTSRQGAVVKRLRAAGLEAAERVGVAPELIARKKDLESYVRHFEAHGELPPTFEHWRHALVGEAYGDILRSAHG